MYRSDPHDWMWAEACDLLERADRMHRRFFRLSAQGSARWEPPADVFEDDGEVVIVVALPGVAAEHVEVVAEPGALVVRAQRPMPLAGTRYALRQLAIPYGYFECRVALPEGRLEALSRELTHGCLVIRLKKVD